MGSTQSNPSAAQKAIIDRLRALELLEKEQAANDDGFVEVGRCDDGSDGSELSEKGLGALRLSPTTLDVSQLEDWQTKLLEDPKNR